MGMFEDNHYMQELSEELAGKKSEEKDGELAKQAREYDKWKLKEIESDQDVGSLNALKNAYTAHIRKWQRVGEGQVVKKFTEVKDARKQELESNG